MRKNIKQWLSAELVDYRILLRSIPSVIVAAFTVAVVLMNLLANKEIYTGTTWLALDCGLLISWLSFLCMDIITKRFGAKASIKISLLATAINLLVCAVLFVASRIPGNWGEFYATENGYVNDVLNNTIGGTWYVLLGSSIAFIVSSVVNSVVNAGIGKWCQKDTYFNYILRSWASTMLGQFVDNMVFSLMVSHVFFGWTLLQCFTCSVSGCLIELVCQVIFTPVGYRVAKSWEKDKVGEQYINHNRGV